MVKAVIFDMDGVIVDSELQWRLAESEFLKRWVPNWREEDYKNITGLSPADLYRWLSETYGVSRPKEEFLGQCRAVAEEIYARRVSLSPFMPEILDLFHKNRIPLAIASSSPQAWIDLVLKRFRLGGFFQAVASADDTQGRGKPCPDIHLLACQRLQTAPDQALAVEDSTVGISAAKKAGLKCAAFRNGSNGDQDFSLADFEIKSLRELIRIAEKS